MSRNGGPDCPLRFYLATTASVVDLGCSMDGRHFTANL